MNHVIEHRQEWDGHWLTLLDGKVWGRARSEARALLHGRRLADHVEASSSDTAVTRVPPCVEPREIRNVFDDTLSV